MYLPLTLPNKRNKTSGSGGFDKLVSFRSNEGMGFFYVNLNQLPIESDDRPLMMAGFDHVASFLIKGMDVMPRLVPFHPPQMKRVQP